MFLTKTTMTVMEKLFTFLAAIVEPVTISGKLMEESMAFQYGQQDTNINHD